MPEVTINYLAVLVAAITSMVVGFLWYGPLFGKAWIRLMGWSGDSPEQIAERKKGMGKGYAVTFVGSLLTAYVLAHFLDYAGAVTATEGAEGAVWAWLGFVVPLLTGAVLWKGKPGKLYALNVFYYLVNLVVMGMILGAWI